MATSVSVDGDTAAARKLDAIGRAAQSQAPVMAKQGEATARAVTGVPTDTGALAKSIRVIDSGDWGFVVGSVGVSYARYVFRGTKYVEARKPKPPAQMASDTAEALSSSIVRAG